MKNKNQLMKVLVVISILVTISLIIKAYIEKEHGEMSARISCLVTEFILLLYVFDDKPKEKEEV